MEKRKRRLRVLIVEDDTVVAHELSMALAGAGFAVVVAGSCATALSLALRFDFAVLALDLPDGNGAELGGNLMDLRQVPDVLVFTRSSRSDVLERARRLGCTVVVTNGSCELLS